MTLIQRIILVIQEIANDVKLLRDRNRNIDGGSASTIYGGNNIINGGGA